MSDTRRLLIGVGAAFRHDDAAGWAVADAVATGADGMRAVRSGGDLATLLDHFASAEDVVVVDAMRSGRRPGRVSRFDARAAPLPALAGGSASSHGLGLPEAIELARALDRLPPRLTVVGIEGGDFSPGEGLSAPVARAVARVVRSLGGCPTRE